MLQGKYTRAASRPARAPEAGWLIDLFRAHSAAQNNQKITIRIHLYIRDGDFQHDETSFSADAVKAVTALLAAAFCPGVAAQDYNAQPTPEELAKLDLEGTELTPAGAIRSGNAESTIPAWKFEPIQPPLGWQPGTFHADPFAEDEVLFTKCQAKSRWVISEPTGLEIPGRKT